MACVWKHPRSPYWVAQFTDERGVRVNRSTRERLKRRALDKALAWEHAARLAAGGELNVHSARRVVNEILERVTGGRESLRPASVAEFFNAWLDTKTKVVGKGTAERYSSIVKRFLDHLGRRAAHRLPGLTHDDIQDFVETRFRKASAKTISVDFKTLSTALNHAKRRGLIDRNPCDLVELPETEGVSRLPFTQTEVKLLLEAAATPDWRLLILCGYYLGGRIGDMAGLRWSQIDLVARTVTYGQGKRRGFSTTTPIHPELLEAFENAAGDDPEAFVMPTLAGRRTNSNGLPPEFTAICKAAGVDMMRVTTKAGRSFARKSFHSLRHTWESVLANQNVSDEVRRKLVGRAGKASQQDYTHHQMDTLRAAVETMPRLKQP